MGDDIHENFFENETAVEDIRTGGAYDTGSESEQEQDAGGVLSAVDELLQERSLKKKRKLADLKKSIATKKQSKKSEGDGDEEREDKDKKNAKKEVMEEAISAERQSQIFYDSQPVGKKSGALVCTLSEEHFAVASTSSSVAMTVAASVAEGGIGLPCPFAATVAVCLPNYKKQLRAPPVEGEMGCPLVIVLCASATRASQVLNRMKGLLHCAHAKLFAKHMKVQEQVEQLGSEHYPIAVGTPNRVIKLFELGALSDKQLQLVLIDNSEDTKTFTAMTLMGVREDLFAFLGKTVQPRCQAGTCKVSLVDTGKSGVVAVPESVGGSAGGGSGKGKGKGKPRPKNMGSSVRKGF